MARRRPALERHMQTLRLGTPPERLRAIKLLRRQRSKALPAVPLLLTALQDDLEEIRSAAADTLVRVGRGAVPLLAAALDRDDFGPKVQVRAIIRRIGGELPGGTGEEQPTKTSPLVGGEGREQPPSPAEDNPGQMAPVQGPPVPPPPDGGDEPSPAPDPLPPDHPPEVEGPPKPSDESFPRRLWVRALAFVRQHPLLVFRVLIFLAAAKIAWDLTNGAGSPVGPLCGQSRAAPVLALLGALLGGLAGAHVGGKDGAFGGSLMGLIGGAFAGTTVGGIMEALVAPLVQVLGSPP
jgi:hypothetical protein